MNAGFTFGLICDGKVTSPPDRLLIVRDGDCGITGYDVKLTPEGADSIISRFEEQGVELPIDYHHSTTETDSGIKAPAAGWIKKLEYVADEGLYAHVEWTEQAAAEIKSRQYKYHSPVILLDKKSGECVELHSVALTNKPRTRDQKELLAAEQEFAMANKKKVKAEEVLPAVEVDTESLPEDQVTELDDLGKAIAQLGQTLADAGIDMAEGMDSMAIVARANEVVAGMKAPEEAPAEGEDAPEPVTSSLELPKGTGIKAIVAEVNKLKVLAAANETLNKRIEVLEAERKAGIVEELIDAQIERGTLLPDDEKQLKAARALAESDPEMFKSVFGSMNPIIEPGSVLKGSPVLTKTQRDKVIAEASREYDAEKSVHPMRVSGCEKMSWVNVALCDEGMDKLSDDEIAALK